MVDASAADRRELERIIRNLAADPWVNQRTTFVLPYPPAILNLYYDGRFKIVYHLPDSDTLKVDAIGYADDEVKPV